MSVGLPVQGILSMTSQQIFLELELYRLCDELDKVYINLRTGDSPMTSQQIFRELYILSAELDEAYLNCLHGWGADHPATLRVHEVREIAQELLEEYWYIG